MSISEKVWFTEGTQEYARGWYFSWWDEARKTGEVRGPYLKREGADARGGSVRENLRACLQVVFAKHAEADFTKDFTSATLADAYTSGYRFACQNLRSDVMAELRRGEETQL